MSNKFKAPAGVTAKDYVDDSDNDVHVLQIGSEDDSGHVRHCQRCMHVPVCAAYRSMVQSLPELPARFPFVKESLPEDQIPNMVGLILAAKCSEYIPPDASIWLNKRKIPEETEV